MVSQSRKRKRKRRIPYGISNRYTAIGAELMLVMKLLSLAFRSSVSNGLIERGNPIPSYDKIVALNE